MPWGLGCCRRPAWPWERCARRLAGQAEGGVGVSSTSPKRGRRSWGCPQCDPCVRFQDPTLAGRESSTNDISHYIGMLDPWYERNVLGLMNLPMDVLCQVCACQLVGVGVPLPRGTGQLNGELLLSTGPPRTCTAGCATWIWDGDGVVRRRVSIPGRVEQAVLDTRLWVPCTASGL